MTKKNKSEDLYPNDGFDQPTLVSDVLLAFPGEVRHLMPSAITIPTNYFQSVEWRAWTSHWFFIGDPFPVWDIGIREGVDPNEALRHLRAIMGSYQPKHEHKEAAVAWLASRWFNGIQKKVV